MVNYNLIRKMFELQDTFNEYTVKSWQTKGLEWYRALWLEAGEAMGSVSWKWWKKETDDLQNLEVELVDMWHFIMSYLITLDPSIKENPSNFAYMFNISDNTEYDIKVLIEEIALVALEKNNNINLDGVLVSLLLRAWYSLGKNIEDLYTSYIVKNCLNKFRQDNGYKDGTYIKMWNGVEDNVIAWSLTNDVEDLENLFDELYIKLEKHYKTL